MKNKINIYNKINNFFPSMYFFLKIWNILRRKDPLEHLPKIQIVYYDCLKLRLFHYLTTLASCKINANESSAKF